MILQTILLAVEAAAEPGKLFDIDATLPFMAVQFVILMAVLNVLFYKPLGKAIDDRANYIRQTQSSAKERLAKAQQLAQEYEEKLASSRRQSQAIIVAAQAEAQKIAAQRIAEAQQEAQAVREKAAKEIEQQKQQALKKLEKEVDALSRQILNKLLGPQLAK